MSRTWSHYPIPNAAPANAPNVLVVMTDDVGFGACSTFGGLIPTPRLDQLAEQGIRYNAFHTTAMCSPTRAALLTGRNHHSVGFGAISNYSIDAPAYTSVLPKEAVTIARILRERGFNTSMFGKNHNTPEWELGPLGPYEHWPIGMGFDYFYGFNAAQTDQFKPALTENMNPLRAPDTPGYHLDADLSERFVHWVKVQKALHPDRPFFTYWAPGTLHEPHQAPPSWIEKFAGRFDQGWDVLREQVFINQQALGIIPPHAMLTTRPAYIPAWDSLGEPVRRLYARQMEVAAAQLSHFDHQFGRALDALDEAGQLDNTLVIFIQGDNGACQEYEYGNTNYDLYGIINETPESMIPKIDLLGGPDAHGTYAPGWGWTMNTPLAESKQIASHLGGMRNGLVVSWPRGIAARGEVRGQFAHVTDVMPTILDVLGIALPEQIDGVSQKPLEGVSFAHTFDQPQAPTKHTEQYFEMLGNRALYQDGWMASTLPPRPAFGDTSGIDPLSFDWALFDLNVDWSQSKDISLGYRLKLEQLRQRFDEYAVKYNLYPLANDQVARMNNPRLRPSPLSGEGLRSFPAGDTRYRGDSFPPVRPGWRCEANVLVGDQPAQGPILSLGSRFAGVMMSMENGRAVFVVNATGEEKDWCVLQSLDVLSQGAHKISVIVADDSSRSIAMQIDGVEVSTGTITFFPVIMTAETYVGRTAIDRPEQFGNFTLTELVVQEAIALV